MSVVLRRLAAATLLATVPVAACSDEPDRAEVTVLAAASLTDVLTELAESFEAEHEGVDVVLSLGSSTDLAEQAADGAPGDVLATADEVSMAVAEDAGAATDPRPFAENVLVIVTPPDDPAGVAGLDDLAGTAWVRCADEAPCGRVALAVLDAAGVDAEPASLEEDVRATLDKVVAGEADAALVYATDAAAAGGAVATVEIPEAAERPTSYVISPLSQAGDGDLAEAFADLVLSDAGRRVLRDAGFTVR